MGWGRPYRVAPPVMQWLRAADIEQCSVTARHISNMADQARRSLQEKGSRGLGPIAPRPTTMKIVATK